MSELIAGPRQAKLSDLAPVTAEDLERERIEIQKERRERYALAWLNSPQRWPCNGPASTAEDAVRFANELIEWLDGEEEP